MQLKAVYRIRGVKEVVSGKGKGTRVAEPGDIFVPNDEETGKNLLADRNAVHPSQSHKHVTNVASASTIIEHAEVLGDGQAIDLGNNTLPAPAAKAPAKGKGGKKAAAAAKAAPAAPVAPADDLGLGDDDGEDEVIE